jgi:CO/xanthine dehydrogenase Mo-binding subunit
MALKNACDAIKLELKERAAIQLDLPIDQVEYTPRRVQSKSDPDRFVGMAEIARSGISTVQGAIIKTGDTGRLRQAHAFGVHVADVEVDPETGRVEIINYTTFQDCGKAINPLQVEGQMQGGATQGIGWALNEAYEFEDGVMKNPTWLDYRMPTALDLPMIDTEIVEVPNPDGPYGIRGVGEVPIVPPLAAIANAIANATGARLTNLPMNPEAVFMAMKDNGNR